MPTTTTHDNIDNGAENNNDSNYDDNGYYYCGNSKDVFMGHANCDADEGEFSRGPVDMGHTPEGGDSEMLDAVSTEADAPHPLDALVTVITSEGLPKGAQEEAPAWVAVLERFGGAMETLVELHTHRLFPSWRESGMRLCIGNPADARRLVVDLNALATRSNDTDDFYSSLALAHAIDTAARDAATAAIVGMESALIDQAGTVRRLREAARDAERRVREAFALVTTAARGTSGPAGHDHITVSVVMQAVHATLETGSTLQGPALARSFYSEVVKAASAFGPSQPPRLVEASSAGFAALQRMRASPHIGRILEALSARDLGVPLLDPHGHACPE
ncbi:hypothetical protein TW95_gp1031 [Pandoravirus inopinatum]|uniref:Uncharacterized protein n=1 Tax=Pandoravirus inopinatum TaxID=1605721 RepID=A0A0B5J7D5_9VIRU|nr:hypothetical protein TW95_gp1031 [Pandoravirus inopinatum]AJF97765.1 hypothetical protein [Pandoravirus inopinatum]